MRYPNHLIKLLELLKKLPGVGNRTAERFAFEMIDWSPAELQAFATVIQETPHKLKNCPTCNCLMGTTGCSFCDDSDRDRRTICVLASSRDAFALDATHEYHGLYHILGELLSPLNGIGPEKLRLSTLKSRLDGSVTELILALDSTLEGDATSLYLKQELSRLPVQVTRLAFGLPMGSSLDYVDGHTLAQAFSGRRHY